MLAQPNPEGAVTSRPVCHLTAAHHRKPACHRFSVLNVTEENDTRLEPGWTTTPRTWSHEEIWDLILNGGVSAHPDDVKALKIQDPEAKADYFVEGVQ